MCKRQLGIRTTQENANKFLERKFKIEKPSASFSASFVDQQRWMLMLTYSVSATQLDQLRIFPIKDPQLLTLQRMMLKQRLYAWYASIFIAISRAVKSPWKIGA